VDDTRLLPIGKITGAHGIKGTLKVFSYAESVASFKPGTPLYLRNTRGQESRLTIRWVKPHSKTILLSLEGIIDRNQAQALSGSELFIDKKWLDALEEGTYYWADLMGLSVYNIEGDCLGRLSSVIRTGSNDVYVVTPAEGKKSREILIPALAWVVKEIDLDKKIMRVDLPEGL
jgi:16S rRNA processing protein RimM